MINFGFTGTQKGMTELQAQALGFMMLEFVKATQTPVEMPLPEFHHGACVGADYQAHLIALKLGLPVVLHPPIKTVKMAICKGATETREPKDYLVRNHDIVDESDVIFATPSSTEEELRSGTWSTIRYARKQRKGLVIIYPDGSTTAN